MRERNSDNQMTPLIVCAQININRTVKKLSMT